MLLFFGGKWQNKKLFIKNRAEEWLLCELLKRLSFSLVISRLKSYGSTFICNANTVFLSHAETFYLSLVIGIAGAFCYCVIPSLPITITPTDKPTDSTAVQIITLDPGHFHAALVQKTANADIDSVVHVYAPGGPELDAYLGLIKQYNERPENPTHWKEEVYTGSDYLDKMITDKKVMW